MEDWVRISHTKCMTMVLHCNAQNLEGVHADGHALHPLLTLENQIDRAREEINKGIPIRSRQENACRV